MIEPFVQPFKTIGDTTLNLHIIKPDTPPKKNGYPAIVFFFCGGWRGFNHRALFPQSAYLASRGVMCFNAEVRVNAIHGTPAETCVIDAKSAIRYVRQNAATLNVDPNRIAASGGSAAGCVTACCGIINGYEETGEDLSISSRPDAMLLFNPRLDTICEGDSEGQKWQQNRLIEIFGDSEKGRPLSPVHNVKPGNPPALIMHGTADERLEVNHMLRFQTAMHNAGNRCDLQLYEGAGHGFFHYRDGNNPWFIETMQHTDRFLASLSFIEGEEQTASFDYTPITV